MPVSKKRKKDGKPVHRAHPVAEAGDEHAPAPDAKPAHLRDRMGKPTNPFVTQQAKRASQRGR